MKIRYLLYLLHTIIQKFPGINLYQVMLINENCLIVMVPKCGTRSLRDALFHNKVGLDSELVHARKKNNLTAKYYRFMTLSKVKKLAKRKNVYVVYRAWDARLQSCWRQKILKQESYFYFWQYFPWIRPQMSYDAFEKRVQAMPECIREKHFMSYSALYSIEDIKLIEINSLQYFLNEQFGVSFNSNMTNA